MASPRQQEPTTEPRPQSPDHRAPTTEPRPRDAQVVNTAWAMLAFLAGTEGDGGAMERAAGVLSRAAAFLMAKQARGRNLE